MFVVKWVSIAAFFIMVCAGIVHFAGEVSKASLICYGAAGVFACGIFYKTTLHRIFPKSNMGDKVADILERTVEARQVALMHHIQHEHQGDLAAMRQLQPAQNEDQYTVPMKWSIVDPEEAPEWAKLQQNRGRR